MIVQKTTDSETNLRAELVRSRRVLANLIRHAHLAGSVPETRCVQQIGRITKSLGDAATSPDADVVALMREGHAVFERRRAEAQTA